MNVPDRNSSSPTNSAEGRDLRNHARYRKNAPAAVMIRGDQRTSR